MCGADRLISVAAACRAGLPPRVRSRPDPTTGLPYRGRITSACAEQTGSRHLNDDGHRDYLRVCGADAHSRGLSRMNSGLPPRVRSRLALIFPCGKVNGITSACAEQTPFLLLSTRRLKDYLRVCGADRFRLPELYPVMGLPPRVRSRPVCWLRSWLPFGITFACAEQTR